VSAERGRAVQPPDATSALARLELDPELAGDVFLRECPMVMGHDGGWRVGARVGIAIPGGPPPSLHLSSRAPRRNWNMTLPVAVVLIAGLAAEMVKTLCTTWYPEIPGGPWSPASP
jgi:hypothetical protein